MIHKNTRIFYAILMQFTTVIYEVNTYKMLGVFPSPVPSHGMVGNALMKGLAEKGHDVTVISPFRMTDAPRNYRLVETSTILEAIKTAKTSDLCEKNFIAFSMPMYELGVQMVKFTFAEPSMQNLLASDEKFDVVIIQAYASEALMGLAEHYNVPLIVISSFGPSIWSADLVGAPSPLSYVPNLLSHLTDRMTIFERITNLVIASYEKFYFETIYLPQQRDLFKKHFPKSKLGMDNIRRNTALVLVNTHVSIGYPRPYMPNLIEVGGLQINRKKKPLPADMQKFLDEAEDGAIYFSMGSHMNSTKFSLEKREVIIETFKSLKQRVLWKFEATELPNKSDNIYISQWFPQGDVLAHPNVKLFITHGGLLSTTEAIYHGKPFVGIPIISDQFLNMARAESGGYGIVVHLKDLSKETLLSAIEKILHNPQYTKSVEAMGARYRDQPMEPLDLATYWVEYVVRHKGAPHLHSAGQDLSFIQYHNLDAIAILLSVILLCIVIIMKIMLKLISWPVGLLVSCTKVKKHAD